MKIQESAENYLETILRLKDEKGMVRSIDIARAMNFTKPSVSRAMSLLRTNGYILMDKEGWIALTDSGMEIASRIYERHKFLSSWLESIGVTPEVAAQDACRIEHDISQETFQMLQKYIEDRTDKNTCSPA
ncbi:MAG: metal-dependent transcriptional regulator [Oscillospiraceae bacterium]|nr:metal-dependent transcriptional regulator [Oscillospiraceae bacterium]MCI9668372.1 metal-dependent transcriptional regulator [Oscillospiraceae bacterium]RKJ55336.1 metal-dependent transcriptional regulator [bacterium 1XD42-8]RKJ66456.1 metal-dependent transcriptional regulator [bacterium 1XD42-1]